MSKKATERKLKGNEAQAVINRLRTSPRKLNLVAQMIRGMNVNTALTQLAFSDKRIAIAVRRALQSAIANAENNHNLNVDALIIKEAYVGKSLVMKRMHTRARGRSARILKPFANLTIVLREQGDAPEAKKKAPKKADKKAAGKAEPKTEKKAEKKPAKKEKA
jgi:large subunit ribosomal protein L22